MNDNLRNWLLDGDASIVCQTMDFLGYKQKEIENKRNEISNKGWGKRLLENQAADGSFGGGLYGPKFISTTYTLLLLKRMGINSNQKCCQKGASLLIQGLRKDGGINFSRKEDVRGETCITGMTLNLLSYFQTGKEQQDQIFQYITENQMDDGGWNCQYPRKANHGSFNTTMLVLEGLQSFKKQPEQQQKTIAMIENLENKGQEFLLNHKLYKSHTTGDIVKEDFLRFPFPYQWKYDVLTALDYFQSSNASYDERLEDAIQLVESKTEEGYLKNYRGQSGKIWFILETVGKPSRYNTLRWQRILSWWNKNN